MNKSILKVSIFLVIKENAASSDKNNKISGELELELKHRHRHTHTQRQRSGCYPGAVAGETSSSSSSVLEVTRAGGATVTVRGGRRSSQRCFVSFSFCEFLFPEKTLPLPPHTSL